MKFFSSILLLAGLLSAPAWAAKTYEIDKDHSSVSFKIRHLVSNVNGSFNEFSGKIAVDDKKPENSSVEFTVMADSINTANKKRDEHLRSGDFFDADKFKEITFKSKKVKAIGKNKYQVEGDLTLHGVTQPVTVKVDYLGETKDPWGNTKSGFKTEFKVARKSYGMVWNKALDAGSLMLGDEVNLTVDVEATEKK